MKSLHHATQSALSKIIALGLVLFLAACGNEGNDPNAAIDSTGTDNDPLSLTLDWTAPSERADGSSLDMAEIESYRIYYGEASGDYQTTVDVADGSSQTYTMTMPAAGNYFFVLTAVDTDGRESVYSTPELEVTL